MTTASIAGSADSAMRGVYQRRFAGFEFVRVGDQIVRGEPVHHRSGCLIVADRRRYRHQVLLGSRDVFCVRSQRSTPGHAVADLERLHLWADRSDHARAFLAGNEWQRRAQTAVAELSIDGIHSRDVDLNDCLGSLRLR